MILQHMGYKVIAEGAETEKEVKLLEKWGVDMIQGYYFPGPCARKLLEKFPEMIRNRRKTCFHKSRVFRLLHSDRHKLLEVYRYF